jgi:hypothetical protein
MEHSTSFGFRNFGQLDLGDRRRTRRLVTLADRLQRHPGGTLPEKLSIPAELRALYRLMNCPKVTHQVIMAGHTAATREQIATLADTTVVIIHDATELDYTTRTKVCPELGQIGEGTHRGYICHNSLAVRADSGETLGLLSQILHHRADVPEHETIAQKRARKSRESRLWVTAARGCGAAPAGVRCVDVSDSLSDTFEYMAFEVEQKRLFVLRARENRKLENPVAGHQYLVPAARALPAQTTREVKISGTDKRRERMATVQIAFAPVRVAVPGKHLGEYAKVPLDLWVVRVWEANPPAGEEPLEWILLTNVPVETAADVQECVGWYQRRPIVEEYHKGQKTGCGIETFQFEKIERLEPAIALISAIATTLLRLRDAARAPDADQRPATDVVAAEYVEVLTAHYRKRLSATPTIKAFYMHVARLGGHQNRKCDGFPGWITLWRGWMKLQAMVDGYRAAEKKNRPKCGKT